MENGVVAVLLARELINGSILSLKERQFKLYGQGSRSDIGDLQGVSFAVCFNGNAFI